MGRDLRSRLDEGGGNICTFCVIYFYSSRISEGCYLAANSKGYPIGIVVILESCDPTLGQGLTLLESLKPERIWIFGILSNVQIELVTV
jgi:hypothetical protein